MKKKIGVIMDPIATIHTEKDSTFAMLLEAQKRNWPIFYMELKDLLIQDGVPKAHTRSLQVFDDPKNWYQLGKEEVTELKQLDIILMRKDPPVDMEYIYATHILDLVEHAGVLVVNKPQSLRDFNEKLIVSLFPQCTPATLVTSELKKLQEFLQQEQEIVCKPLDRMGGQLVFRVNKGDANQNVIFETLTDNGKKYCIAQRYVPEVTIGDKRILLIHGNPVPYALLRVPIAGDARANLAVGGQGKGVELTKRDYWICEQIKPLLQAKGLYFVGIDVIGDYLTEINITCPTCIRQIDKAFGVNISSQLLDYLSSQTCTTSPTTRTGKVGTSS